MANEKRLIDANELVDTIYRSDEALHSTQWETDEIVDQIDRIPTVDAVEVVRCKDCKYGIYDEEEQLWECVVGADVTGDADTYAMFHEYNKAEHFCSYGERKDNGV